MHVVFVVLLAFITVVVDKTNCERYSRRVHFVKKQPEIEPSWFHHDKSCFLVEKIPSAKAFASPLKTIAQMALLMCRI